VRTLLRRCLAKEPSRRLDSAAAARLDIEEMLSHPRVVAPRRRPRPSVVAAGAIVATAAIVTALLAWRPNRGEPGVPAPEVRFTIDTPPAFPLSLQGVDRDFALARDGSFLVYRGGNQAQLIVRRFDRLEAVPLPGISNARAPFVSPDNRWIGFIENNTSLKKVAVGGGSPMVLATLPGSPRGACWIDNATVVIATNATGLLRVPADGGEPSPLTRLDPGRPEVRHLYPAALPGGRSVLFTVTSAQPQDWVVAVLDLATGAQTTVVRGARHAEYIGTGHLVYALGEGLYAARFDLQQQRLVGEPVPIDEKPLLQSAGAVNAALSDRGTLVYVPASIADMSVRSLAWVDRQGRETNINAPPGRYASVRLSPDGTRVALELRDPQPDIWVRDLQRGTQTRLTFTGAMAPVWVPDGRRIVFTSAEALPNLFVRSADGTGLDARVTTSANIQVPISITPDAASIVSVERRPQTGSDLVRVALSGSGPSRSLLETGFTEQNGEVSPDGRFLAYESNESGMFEIHVRPYPDVENGRWQVSKGGGTRPTWTRSGRELVYLDASDHLTIVPVDGSASAFHAGVPSTLPAKAYTPLVAWRHYDVSTDGQRFLVLSEEASDARSAPTQSFVVVEHWLDGIGDKLGRGPNR